LQTLRSPDESWRPLRLGDRVFVNMSRLDDRYTANPNSRFFYDFEHAAEARYTNNEPGGMLVIDHSAPIEKKKNTRVRFNKSLFIKYETRKLTFFFVELEICDSLAGANVHGAAARER
jgi:hypothetical protein